MNEISDRVLGGTKVKTKYDREVYSLCVYNKQLHWMCTFMWRRNTKKRRQLVSNETPTIGCLNCRACSPSSFFNYSLFMRFLGQNTSSVTSDGQNFLVAKRGNSVEQLNLGTKILKWCQRTSIYGRSFAHIYIEILWFPQICTLFRKHRKLIVHLVNKLYWKSLWGA